MQRDWVNLCGFNGKFPIFSDEESTQMWLKHVGCDQKSMDLILEQHYTKRDLIDFVSREELIQIGIP
jgi:hypothetical protein